MSTHYADGFTLIGLHKLAELDGQGLVPELYALILDRADAQRSYANVVLFPAWEARMPGEAPAQPLADCGRVVEFPPATSVSLRDRAKAE